MEDYKILVVDDEKDSRLLIKGILLQANYTVNEASNGEEGLEKLKAEDYDLVVLDVQMPKMDGYEVCFEMKKNEDLMNIPIFMLTVLGDTIDKVTGYHLGIDDYMTKPFEPEEFLARVGAVLKRKKMYEHISMTDGLTGLYNIQFFKRQIEIFFNMSKRMGQVFSMAIVDVDKFKEINDKYGHSAGDYVLKRIAEIMKEEIRESDVVARYGGDEFIIIFPKSKKEQAESAAGVIKSKIANEEFVSPKNGEKINVTVSIGTSTWRNDMKDTSQLFDIADEQMYSEKNKNHKKRK